MCFLKHPVQMEQACMCVQESTGTGFDPTDEVEESYELSQSVWDGSLLLGIDGLGSWCSLVGVLLVLLTIAVQSWITYYVVTSLNEQEYTEAKVHGFRAWRGGIAHEFLNVDRLTRKTLASRVCENDDSLASSTNQASSYAALQSYLEGEAGMYFAGLCIMIWSVSVINDVTPTLTVMRTALRLRGSNTVLQDTPDDSGKKQIVSLSHARVAYFLTVQLVRLIIVGFLLKGGVYFLAYTVTFGDLLLNGTS